MSSNFTPYPVPDGIVQVEGKPYMPDGTGRLTALESISPLKKLRDEMVRKEFGYALALSAQVVRFKAHLMANLDAFDDLILQEFGVTIGGKKGNRTYTSFDGLLRIEVRMQDRVAYGPEMQAAKALFDECLNEWAKDARPEMRSIVTNAFETDKEGQINRANIHTLLRTESDDLRWTRGQEAIQAAIYVIAAKEYVRFSTRESQKGEWGAVPINLAKA